ncbi:XrtA/PEP-CTERM system amidotransferase [Magnetospira sp. QH-2]|uniref:XrtA/PEP-CTERM system amidotransferase n=1 Tax=Magnetospira sp. (strain QH-2) TaxID=1288970 RepID=UPI0003E80E1D|nr:XrtA/PEP-CTERM system amidotransferase [Magnetospira sp. QH-2]CCQ72973.1 Asparagine synthase (Glutamine-hydrolyzing) [Magnetospira sp. QH-2]
MCGIVGIYHDSSARPIDEALLSHMNDTQFHRGPDEGGLFVAPGIGLGHRRLSILDLSGGRQPLYNEDDSVVVVYNGEIYNFQELFDELKALGHQFRTHCDTEAIVHAWEEWGEDCVHRFRGMFVFAIWDSNKDTLFLARDRLGIKPLYYAPLADGTLVFGSELKSVLPYPGVPRDLDPAAVEEYFSYGYVPDPRSIFKGVYKLESGHTLTYRRGMPTPQPRQYWDVRFDADVPKDPREIQEQLIERLREAVKIRMIAEVPLGAFLSGGVDSSAVVAMMAESSEKPVDTCSMSFAHKDYDESAYAQMVAERYHTNHRVQQVDPDSFDLIDQLATFYDEPFADSSAMPTYRVCKLAREKVTVALSGDGGDEVYAGYRRYPFHSYEEMVRGKLPQGIRKPLFGMLGATYPKLDWAPKFLRAKSTFQSIARDADEGFFHSVSVMPDHLRRRLYSERMTNDLQGYHAVEVLRRHMKAAPTDHPLSKVQYADMKTWLPGDILPKVDRTSMAVSLEVRVPVLDHKFVEWSCGLPPDMKLNGREGKYIFKKALEPHLPDDILYRKKMGFSVPLAAWFRGPLKDRVRDVVTGDLLGDCGLFDQKYLKTLVDQHQAGLRDHSAPLWTIVMFESFLRKTREAGKPAL